MKIKGQDNQQFGNREISNESRIRISRLRHYEIKKMKCRLSSYKLHLMELPVEQNGIIWRAAKVK